MAYNADNHRMMLPVEARGVGMVTVRNTGLCQDAEQRLRRMMRNPEKNTGASSYKARKRVAERIMRQSGSAKAIPMVDAATLRLRRLESAAMLSDAQLARLATA